MIIFRIKQASCFLDYCLLKSELTVLKFMASCLMTFCCACVGTGRDCWQHISSGAAALQRHSRAACRGHLEATSHAHAIYCATSELFLSVSLFADDMYYYFSHIKVENHN